MAGLDGTGDGTGIKMWCCDQPSCRHRQRQWTARCPKCQKFSLRAIDLRDLEPPPIQPPPDPSGDAAEHEQDEDEDEDEDGTGPVPLCDVEEADIHREKTGMAQLDNVLGGGIVPGGVYLLSADPGGGKSTLTLQMADGLKWPTLYATGEESVAQVAQRARRIDTASHRILIVHETKLERILRHAVKKRSELLIIDSIQTMMLAIGDDGERIPGRAGTPTQIRECTKHLMGFAKRTGTAVWIIGHVTADGEIAGPKALDHFVDVIMWMDVESDVRRRIRILIKNRFGPSTNIARYDMTHEGFVDAKDDPPPDPDPDPDQDSGDGMPLL